MPKKFKQFLEEQKAKAELEKYDIYKVNDETLSKLFKLTPVSTPIPSSI